jgi:hypothetical protein
MTRLATLPMSSLAKPVRSRLAVFTICSWALPSRTRPRARTPAVPRASDRLLEPSLRSGTSLAAIRSYVWRDTYASEASGGSASRTVTMGSFGAVVFGHRERFREGAAGSS